MRLTYSSRRNVVRSVYVLLAGCALACTGCLKASLASNTGQPPPGFYWSNERKQAVHVGETVEFDLVLTDGSGAFMPAHGPNDYGVLMIGYDRQETTADADGRFRFSYTFEHEQPGDRVLAYGAVYEQRLHRDYMLIGGEWIACESPSDVPDRRLAHTRILFDVYKTDVAFTIEKAPNALAFDTGVIRLRRADGTVDSVFVDMPGRPGFMITGPDGAGAYEVRYSPTGTQLTKHGKTTAEFLIYDIAGRAYTKTAVLDTP